MLVERDRHRLFFFSTFPVSVMTLCNPDCSCEAVNAGRLYVYSSKPRAPRDQSTKVSSKKSQNSVARQPGVDTEGENFVMGVEDASPGDETDQRETALILKGATATCSNPLRQSIVRSSLREIPAEEVRRSGVSICVFII